jgi:ribosome recycling factor
VGFGLQRAQGFAKAAKGRKAKEKGKAKAKKGATVRLPSDDELESDLPVDLAKVAARMEKSLTYLEESFATLRIGRAAPELLEGLDVEAYGETTSLQAVASVSVRSATVLIVKVHDETLTGAVATAVRDCGLGLNPQTDTPTTVTVTFPKVTQESRDQVMQAAKSKAEEFKTRLRKYRQDGINDIKKWERASKDSAKGGGKKDKKKKKGGEEDAVVVSEEEIHRLNQVVQDLIDYHVQRIDELLAAKDEEINGPEA